MKIQDLLRKDVMLLDLQATEKTAVIEEMIKSLVDHGYVTDFETFKEGILAREALTSTGLGDGIAMPHSKNSAVKEATVLFAKSNKGVDYESLDGQPTDLFFMIAAPEGANDTHLAALAELSQYLMKDGFADKLRQVTSADQVIELFDQASEKAEEPVQVPANDSGDFIVAVTACTTGIAHTYMAQEALQKVAAEMGVGIKVETNGASGVGNQLTAEDIRKAKSVIIAADKAVEMDRFDGKPLVNRPVADGIRKTEELINLALSGDTEVYRAANGAKAATASNEKQSLGGAFYKHLMSGVSQMLPFVIGGGIMIALAFLIDGAFGVPQDSLGNLGSYHELASMFMKIGGAAFGLMLPVFAGYVAYSIAEKPGLVAGFVAGAIAKEGFAFGKIPYAAGGEATSTLAGVSSGFLGALVGGFIAGALVLAIKKYVKVPRSLEGAKSILILPLFGTILTGFVMLAVNIPMAAINTAMNDFLGGVGLAAPQLDISKRIIAVLVPNIVEEGETPQETYDLQAIMYNPKIVSHSVQDAALGEGEGCLSVDRVVPGYVVRHARVTVDYFDKDGEKHRIKLKGYNSIVVQHEIDHLNGIMFYDRINEKDPFAVKDGLLILE